MPLLFGIALVVSLWGVTGAGHQAQPEAPLAPLVRGSLDVWAPDTFFTGGEEPPARITRQYQWSSLLSEFRSDFPGFDLRFNVMARAAFVQATHLAPPNPPPDIVFVDNQSELAPLVDSNAVIGMLGSRFGQNGWWLIFRQSKNFGAAEAFLLWLSQSPHWQPWQLSTAPMRESDSAAAQAVATEAVNDYLRADAGSLSSVMDPQASGFFRLARGESESVGRVEPLLTFGDSRLAFVLTSAVCRGEKSLGISHSALVLRKVEGRWKVLLFLEGALPSLEGVLRLFDRLRLEDGPQEALPVAKLLMPADHASITRFPQGELQWEAVDSHLSTYVVESQFCNPGRKYPNWSLSRIELTSPRRVEPLVKIPLPFGVGKQPHRWRIWAISSTGDVSISDWRTIDFTN